MTWAVITLRSIIISAFVTTRRLTSVVIPEVLSVTACSCCSSAAAAAAAAAAPAPLAPASLLFPLAILVQAVINVKLLSRIERIAGCFPVAFRRCRHPKVATLYLPRVVIGAPVAATAAAAAALLTEALVRLALLRVVATRAALAVVTNTRLVTSDALIVTSLARVILSVTGSVAVSRIPRLIAMFVVLIVTITWVIWSIT